MEHKLITGGEQFLPFARSRIKALRAAGLKYASQKFEVDGCSIKVRIEPGQDYITLSGGGGRVWVLVKISKVSCPSSSGFADSAWVEGKALSQTTKNRSVLLKYTTSTAPTPATGTPYAGMKHVVMADNTATIYAASSLSTSYLTRQYAHPYPYPPEGPYYTVSYPTTYVGQVDVDATAMTDVIETFYPYAGSFVSVGYGESLSDTTVNGDLRDYVPIHKTVSSFNRTVNVTTRFKWGGLFLDYTYSESQVAGSGAGNPNILPYISTTTEYGITLEDVTGYSGSHVARGRGTSSLSFAAGIPKLLMRNTHAYTAVATNGGVADVTTSDIIAESRKISKEQTPPPEHLTEVISTPLADSPHKWGASSIPSLPKVVGGLPGPSISYEAVDWYKQGVGFIQYWLPSHGYLSYLYDRWATPETRFELDSGVCAVGLSLSADLSTASAIRWKYGQPGFGTKLNVLQLVRQTGSADVAGFATRILNEIDLLDVPAIANDADFAFMLNKRASLTMTGSPLVSGYANGQFLPEFNAVFSTWVEPSGSGYDGYELSIQILPDQADIRNKSTKWG